MILSDSGVYEYFYPSLVKTGPAVFEVVEEVEYVHCVSDQSDSIDLINTCDPWFNFTHWSFYLPVILTPGN